MTARAISALHDIHTATNDVLKGYGELEKRAQPDIQAVIRRLSDLHRKHAAEQQAELLRLQEAVQDDTSMQGTLNKVVVMVRDWVSDLDHEVLPAVRDGEESLSQTYKNQVAGLDATKDHDVIALLSAQHAAISEQIVLLEAK